MRWVYLVLAIACEVTATLSLQASRGGRVKRWLAVVVAGYLVSFGFLSLALAAGLPLGVAYGIWAAVGVAVVAVLARVIFGQPLTAVMAFGILLVAAGVVLVELGTAHPG